MATQKYPNLNDLAHTEACHKRQAKDITHAYEIGIEYGKYLAKYPDYHRPCAGTGMIAEPYSYDSPGYVDVCGCLEEGYCPRCMKAHMFSGDDPLPICANCGWNQDGEGQEDFAAPVQLGDTGVGEDCTCFETYMSEYPRDLDAVQTLITTTWAEYTSGQPIVADTYLMTAMELMRGQESVTHLIEEELPRAIRYEQSQRNEPGYNPERERAYRLLIERLKAIVAYRKQEATGNA